MNKTTKKEQPVKTFRSGYLKVAIWKKEFEGRPLYSVSQQRGYKDKEGNFDNTTTLRNQDLLPMSQLHVKAWNWINEQNGGPK